MPFKLIVQNSKVILKTVANYIINASGIKDLFTGSSNVDSNGKIDWTLQHYSGTAASFVSNNPILLLGQIGIETDNLDTNPLFKIGNGVDVWTALPYANQNGGTGTTELDPVISQLNTPPVSPIIGDRYLIGTSPTGVWVSKNNNIADWNGSSWTYTAPVTDYIIYVTSTLDTLRYNGSSWVSWAGTAILQNGNSPTVSLVIGTNNNQIVYIKSNNTNRFSFDTVNTSLVELSLNTETANTIPYLDSNKKLKSVTLGSGLNLSSGVLSATSTGGTWGSITGTLSNQTDLQSTLDNKLNLSGSNSNQDVDLGNYSLNAKSLHVKGTAGAGHLGLKHQSSSITANASESSLGADSIGNPVWKNDGNAIDSLELQSNKTSTVTGNESSTSKYTTIKGMYDWVTGLFVKKGTLTTNYLQKADGLGGVTDSSISDDGVNVKVSVLTPSKIVGTDASKNLVSIPFGTTAGTVLEGNAITQTITNGVIDKSPSEDAVFDGLTLKVDKNTSITGATKTKITYDSKGLVTSGADATTADIADSLNKRYVTDANLTVIGNTSGTNTGDQTLSGLGGVPTTRSLTINGTTYDLSADRTWTISTASNVAIKDEGSTLTSAVTSIDFIGSAVTTTAVGNDVTVNITGGGVASATNNLFSYYNFI